MSKRCYMPVSATEHIVAITRAYLQQPPKIKVTVVVQSQASARDRPPDMMSLSIALGQPTNTDECLKTMAVYQGYAISIKIGDTCRLRCNES